jgi:hypothetical protein
MQDRVRALNAVRGRPHREGRMTTSRTGRRGLARIIAAGFVVGLLVLPVAVGSAVAATAGSTVAVPWQTPPGDDGGGSGTDPDPGGGTGSGTTDPDTGNGGGSTDPDTGRGSGSTDPGAGSADTGRPDPDPAPGGGLIRPTTPNAIQQLEEERRRQEREAAEAARKAEEQRIKAEQRAIREAAERREREAEARQSWHERGRPDRMVTVRADRVEVVNRGNLSTLVPRQPGTLSLQALDRMVPDDWIIHDGDTATVTVSIVLAAGVAMQIADIASVKLTGGPELSDAAALYTGSGRLRLKGITLSGVDRNGQPLPFESAGRPFIEVSGQGELNATDTTITDMGLPEAGEKNARPAVSFNTGSSGSLIRTTLRRNNVGVQLSGSQGVRLDALTVTESEGDGIVLDTDAGTRMANLRAEGNGGNGMVVSGETTERPISGLTTLNNRLYGLVVTQQRGTQVSGVSTEADEAGGLRLNQAVDVHVTDFSATDQPIGIFTHVGSTGITLDNIRTSGGRRGVVVEKSTTNLELRNSAVEGSRVAGVSIGGKEIRVHDTQISDAKAAVRLERGSGHIELATLTINGGRDGIVTSPGASDVTIADLTAYHVEDDAIRSVSPGATISGGTITGGTTGLDIAAATTITAVSIDGASEGIHARSPEPVRAENISIDALNLGLNVAPGTQFVLANSSVHALEAVRGAYSTEGVNNISLPPLNLLAAMGVPLILLAIVLEQVHAFRQRNIGGSERHKPPAIPVGVG